MCKIIEEASIFKSSIRYKNVIDDYIYEVEKRMLPDADFKIDKYIFMTYESLTAVRIAAGSICFAETISLLESLRALHPNAHLSKILSKVIKSKAEKYLDIDLSDIEKPNDTNFDSKHKK